MKYTPQINDYVQWKSNEGWVYFVCESYITIEIGTKHKRSEQLINGTPHQKDHILLVCPNYHWEELKCIRRRESIYD